MLFRIKARILKVGMNVTLYSNGHDEILNATEGLSSHHGYTRIYSIRLHADSVSSATI